MHIKRRGANVKILLKTRPRFARSVRMLPLCKICAHAHYRFNSGARLLPREKDERVKEVHDYNTRIMCPLCTRIAAACQVFLTRPPYLT